MKTKQLLILAAIFVVLAIYYPAFREPLWAERI